jgi:hypothetical protein
MTNDPIKNLQDAIDWAEKNYPLPRCRHGKALKDAAGDLLEPTCGCRLQGCVIVCPPEPEPDAGSWDEYQHIKAAWANRPKFDA